MAQYKMISDRCISEFRRYLARHPELIGMPPLEFAADHSGAHDVMPFSRSRRRRRATFDKLHAKMRNWDASLDADLPMHERLRLEDTSLDESLPLHERLQSFLQSRGLSSDDIEHALTLLPDDDGIVGVDIETQAGHYGGYSKDDPPDLASGGEPRPGGSKTAFRPDGSGNTRELLDPQHRPPGPGVKDARRMAFDAAAHISIDATPTPCAPALNNTVCGLVDARVTSSRRLQSFARRWPEAARIKFC